MALNLKTNVVINWYLEDVRVKLQESIATE